MRIGTTGPRNARKFVPMLFKQSAPRDSQFLRGERKSACRDVVDLVSRRVLHALERGVSNTQTPCLVISVCAVAETALASTPPLSLLRWPIRPACPPHSSNYELHYEELAHSKSS